MSFFMLPVAFAAWVGYTYGRTSGCKTFCLSIIEQPIVIASNQFLIPASALSPTAPLVAGTSVTFTLTDNTTIVATYVITTAVGQTSWYTVEPNATLTIKAGLYHATSNGCTTCATC